MRFSFVYSGAVAVALSSCVTTPPISPIEFNVPASATQARSALVSNFSSLGYRIISDTDHSLTVERQQTFGESALINRRIQYQVVVSGDGPTKIQPRVIMYLGRDPNVVSKDVTGQKEMADQLKIDIAPAIRQLGGR